MSIEAARRTLLKIIGSQLIPLATRREPPSVILMEPEYLRRTCSDISIHPGKPLKFGRRMRSPIRLQHWPEQQVHAIRFPCFTAVIEGEIDWRVGVTQHEEPHGRKEEVQADYIHVPLSEGTFFLTPAGVPYGDGHGMHWERPAPRKEQAVIFWMVVLPSGLNCHYCRSTATEHRSSDTVFVHCTSIYELMRPLENELRAGEPGNQTVIKALLQVILIHAQRALEQQAKSIPTGIGHTPQGIENLDSNLARDALQRALAYVEAHLHETLSQASVASCAHLSPRQLNRYFQRELGLGITDYIIQRRLEAARLLLQDTDLLVWQVGEAVGYQNKSSFTQIFKRCTGISPNEWRHLNRKLSNKEETPSE